MLIWLYFFLLIPLNNILPDSWGLENDVLETAQFICIIISLVLCYRNRNNNFFAWGGSSKALCYSGSLFFFLLGMREISWGRTVILHPDGSIYQYSELGLYGQLVDPIRALLVAMLIYGLYRARLWTLLRSLEFPKRSFALLMLFVLMSWIGENFNLCAFNGNLAEELAELGAYVMMLSLVSDYFKKMSYIL